MEEVVVCRGGEKKEVVELDRITCNLVVKTEVKEVIVSEMNSGASFGENFKHVGQAPCLGDLE